MNDTSDIGEIIDNFKEDKRLFANSLLSLQIAYYLCK